MADIGITDVRQWMEDHRNDIIEDIRKIVNIRSVSEPDSDIGPFGEGCRKVLKTMLSIGEKKGFCTDNFDYYGGRISCHSGTNGKEVGIWSHLDVVPEGAGWTFPPYEMTVVDNFLIGRGVQDNKSSAVGILYVLLCLKEMGVPLKWNYSLYVGCSEENTMDDIAYLATHIKMPELSLVADCGFPVCFGEKGSLSLEFQTKEMLPEGVISIEGGTSSNSIPDKACIMFTHGFLSPAQKESLRSYKGITVWDGENKIIAEAVGRSAHIINPEQGVNAVTVLAKGLLSCGLGDREPFSDWLDFLAGSGCDGWVTGKDLVGCISGISVKERRLSAAADYRYPILDDRGKRSDGSAVIALAREAAQRYGFVLQVKKNSKAMYRPPEDPVVQCLTESYQKYSGYRNPAYTMSGGTYARKLPNGIGFGMALPGKRIYCPEPSKTVGDFHQADESICIDQLLEAMAIYVMCLVDFDKKIELQENRRNV